MSSCGDPNLMPLNLRYESSWVPNMSTTLPIPVVKPRRRPHCGRLSMTLVIFCTVSRFHGTSDDTRQAYRRSNRSQISRSLGGLQQRQKNLHQPHGHWTPHSTILVRACTHENRKPLTTKDLLRRKIRRHFFPQHSRDAVETIPRPPLAPRTALGTAA